MKVNSVAVFLIAAMVPLARADAASSGQISYTIQTVAGTSDVGDGGSALQAAIGDAQGVAVDATGNVFIADTYDHRVRKVTPDGKISTVAGDGSPGFQGDGGPASAARLNNPYGIAIDRAGNLYIADLGNNRVRKVGVDGTIITVPGTENLLAPRNVALDAASTLYISEFNGHRVRHLRSDGVLESIAGTGASGFSGDDGPAAAAQLSFPAGLTFDNAGNLYIADSGNSFIRKVAGGTITTVTGVDSGGASLLYLPTAVAIDNVGNLYVADNSFHSLHQFTAAGVMSDLPGAGRDLALDGAGNLFIAGGSQLVELTPALALVTLAGNGSYWFRGDGGPASSARLRRPVAIALDAAGSLYIADRDNLRLRVVNPAGTISTVAGDGSAGMASSQLSFPSGVAVDNTGSIYISDQDNYRIQEMTASGTMTTLAGIGTFGFNGDGFPGTSTSIDLPGALALASDGSLYFADTGNKRVRKLNAQGIVSTVSAARAGGLALDSSGNVYLTDAGLHEVVRVDPQGRATVIAGTGSAGFGGDGGPAASAQLNSPAGLAIDATGNIYIADTGNGRIRTIGADGVIRTIAGNGTADFDGDGGLALSAALNSPTGLAVDGGGNIWIADTMNNRVRKLTPAPIAVEQTAPLAVANAASYLSGPVAPGEMVAIFGIGIGPVNGAGGALDASGSLVTELGQTKVLFDGAAAPLFYVQDSQVNAQAPYEIAAKSTVDVEVFFKGVSRGKVTVPVASSAPGLFTVIAGTGQVIAINRDGKLNSPVDPAARGSVVTLYATGEGLTNPVSQDGKLATAPYPKPVLGVTLTAGGYPADILFAGEAPGFAGLMQINARLPGVSALTGSVPLVLRVGTASSQTGVTITVR